MPLPPSRRQAGARITVIGAALLSALSITTGALAQQGPPAGPAAPGVAPPPAAQIPPGPPPGGDIIDPGPPPGGDIIDSATDQMFVAVINNDFAQVQNAVAAGADINAVDRFGLSPIDIAIDKGHYEIAHFLLSVRNFRPGPAGESPGRPPAAVPGTVPSAPGAPPVQAAVPPDAPRAAAAMGAAAGATAASPEFDTPADPAESLDPLAALPPPDPALDTRFLWPEGEPNPFDPNVPVFGGVIAGPGSVFQ